MSSTCYFCEFVGRSDNRRRHCISHHTAASVTAHKLPNNLTFKRDTENANIVICLKADGNRMNCGYCFDCQTEIVIVNGCPNPLGKIQSHSCRERKERKKKDTTVEMGARVPVTTSCIRLTEDDYTKMTKEVIAFEIDYEENLDVNLKKTHENFQNAVKRTVKQLKTIEAAPQTSTGAGMLSQVQVAFSAKFPKQRNALKQHITDTLSQAQDLVDSDDEDGYDDDAERFDILVYALKSTLDFKEVVAKDRAAAGSVSAAHDAELTQKDVAIADMSAQLNTLTGNYVSQSNELAAALEKIRLLESQLKDSVITHTL